MRDIRRELGAHRLVLLTLFQVPEGTFGVVAAFVPHLVLSSYLIDLDSILENEGNGS